VRRDVPGRHRDRRPHGPRAGAFGAALATAALLASASAGCGGAGSTSTAATPRTTSTQGTEASSTTTPPSAGGGDTGSSAGLTQSQAIRAAVEATLASRDPEQACGMYATEHYLRAAYGGRGGCLQAQRPGSAATSLRSLSVQVQSGTARASATLNGGPYDGQQVRISLVKERGTWMVDSLRANVPVGP
jgi:ABC-type transport system substrate-binding protein